MSCTKLLCVILTLCALLSHVFAYDYCEVLQKSLLFYEAQRSGRLPSTNRVPWRGNSALGDCTATSCTQDANGDGNLAGGYYDAGDGVKFLFPASFTTTTLAWGFIEFQSAIEACGQTQQYLDAIKWSTDFILKAHPSPNELWGQVGNGGLDHSFWGPPEDMTMNRPAYKIDASNPGTDLALEAASALAAASMAFKSADASYSNTLLVHARQLYTLGYEFRGFYHDSITDAASYYKSYSYNDELVWGSTWLYRATGENSYLKAAEADYATYSMKSGSLGQSFDWDNKSPGVLLNMYKITGESQYLTDAQAWMNSWYPGGGMTYTPGGLAWLRQWGPLRYTSGSAFLALLISDSASNSWAQKQIDYMLGSNPAERSYVCGYGNNPPINPHHRAAHGSTVFNIDNPVNNLHVLTGALVGGPGISDDYVDDRHDYVKNEVAVDYNAAFTAAIAGLAKLSGSSGSSPPAETPAETTGAPASAPTEASATSTTTTTQAPPSSATTKPTTGTSTGSAISVQLSSSSTSWWFAVAILNGAADTAKVEFTDSNGYTAFTAMASTNWGYFTFSPTSEIKAPISLRLTSANGDTVELANVVPSLSAFTPIATSQQYGKSARSTTTTTTTATLDLSTLKLQVHQGATVWWFAAALVGGSEAAASVEVQDATLETREMLDKGWGFWILPSNGNALQTPLTVTARFESGASATFVLDNITPNEVVESQ